MEFRSPKGRRRSSMFCAFLWEAMSEIIMEAKKADHFQ
jgi:hypothetical protein